MDHKGLGISAEKYYAKASLTLSLQHYGRVGYKLKKCI